MYKCEWIAQQLGIDWPIRYTFIICSIDKNLSDQISLSYIYLSFSVVLLNMQIHVHEVLFKSCSYTHDNATTKINMWCKLPQS